MTFEEIKLVSWHTEATPSEIEAGMDVTLDTTEALRDQAAINLKPRGIQTRDIVLRRVPKSQAGNKLQAKWEGPFLVSESPRQSVFRLQTLEGVEDPYSWKEDMIQGWRTQAEAATPLCIL